MIQVLIPSQLIAYTDGASRVQAARPQAICICAYGSSLTRSSSARDAISTRASQSR